VEGGELPEEADKDARADGLNGDGLPKLGPDVVGPRPVKNK